MMSSKKRAVRICKKKFFLSMSQMWGGSPQMMVSQKCLSVIKPNINPMHSSIKTTHTFTRTVHRVYKQTIIQVTLMSNY